MKRPGLTPAMRRALENARDHGDTAFDLRGRSAYGGHVKVLMALRNRDLLDPKGDPSPRGHAAIAAPRVTAAELAMLEFLAAVKVAYVRGGDVVMARKLSRIRRDGTYFVSFDCATRRAFLTPAGTTALNNVRAASGSADWREAK